MAASIVLFPSNSFEQKRTIVALGHAIALYLSPAEQRYWHAVVTDLSPRPRPRRPVVRWLAGSAAVLGLVLTLTGCPRQGGPSLEDQAELTQALKAFSRALEHGPEPAPVLTTPPATE